MTKIIGRVEGHYEVHEAPFSRTYEWHPAYVTLECECGEGLTLSGTSPVSVCRCGSDHGESVRGIRERESRRRHEATHPWQHDAQEREEQHHRDEAAYPEGSPWRYDDV